MFGLGSGKSIVGLDIGSSCIKAIELKRSKGEIVVSHLGVEPLASDIVVDSMIVDSGSVSSAISKIFGEHSIKIRTAPDIRPAPGSTIALRADPAAVRLFDRETGSALT